MNAIVLPWPPSCLSSNARPNYFDKARATKAYRGIVGYHAKGAPTIERPSLTLVPLVKPPQRRRDIDNIVGALKAAIDGLTDAAWWDDDSDIERLTIVKPIMYGWPERGILALGASAEELNRVETDIATLRARAETSNCAIEWLSMMTGDCR